MTYKGMEIMIRNICSKSATVRVAAILLASSFLFSGCAGNFGSTAKNMDITNAFQSGQTSPELTYYFRQIPYQGSAIAGLQQPYVMDEQWQRVDMHQTSLAQLVSKLPSSAFGAEILDQKKRPIGILYTHVKLLVRVKDNQRVSIYSPKPVRFGGGK
jgi:hypothetical protein